MCGTGDSVLVDVAQGTVSWWMWHRAQCPGGRVAQGTVSWWTCSTGDSVLVNVWHRGQCPGGCGTGHSVLVDVWHRGQCPGGRVAQGTVSW